MRGNFFLTEAFYSPRQKIAPVQKIAVYGGISNDQTMEGGFILTDGDRE